LPATIPAVAWPMARAARYIASGRTSRVSSTSAGPNSTSRSRIVAPISERYPTGRWVPSPNQHVTVKFLGSTWPRDLDGVLACVGDVATRHEPLETRVSELGAFPSPRRARVLWVGLDDPGAMLARIAADLDDTLDI